MMRGVKIFGHGINILLLSKCITAKFKILNNLDLT